MDVPVDREKVERSSWPLAELGRRFLWAKRESTTSAAGRGDLALRTAAEGEALALAASQPPEDQSHPGEDWLVARALRRAFKGRLVVEDVSVAVRRGEAVGLLGPNGAGKTTVFYMITGL